MKDIHEQYFNIHYKNGDKQCKENEKNTNSTNMQVHRYKYI